MENRREWEHIVTYIQRLSPTRPDGTYSLDAHGPYTVKGQRASRIDAPETALRSLEEIDLILYQNGVVNPIEIKKSAAPANATRHFSVLNPIEREPATDEFDASHLKTTIGAGAVVCMASDLIPIDRKNWYIPAWCI